jgi:hypothetical protein
MAQQKSQHPQPRPGRSILGGAAGGFSYEGAVHDALAREEAERLMEVAQTRRQPTVGRDAAAQHPRERR